MSRDPLSRAISTLLCAAAAATAPGLPSYAAAAGVVRLRVSAPVSSATGLPAVSPAAHALPSAGSPVLGLGPAPALDAMTFAAPVIRAHAAPQAEPAASAALQPIRKEVSAALETAGDLDRASPSSLRGLGERLETALTGAPASLDRSADLSAPVPIPMGEFASRGGQLARPAGDLIRRAVAADNDNPSTPAPTSVEIRAAAPAPRGPDGPFWPKLLAAGLALVPMVYFGFPMVAALSLKALLYAALVLPLAAMPFMGPKTPAFLKSLPGQAMIWNGLALLLSGHAIIAGGLAALGGWGFSRYAASRGGDKAGRFDDASEQGAFLGALGSAVSIGAAWTGLMGPWGWAALGLAAVTSPLLLMHLPGRRK